MPTVGELLGRCLRAVGTTCVFGEPVPGLTHVGVPESWMAVHLADCDGRLGPGPGCALLRDRTLRLSSKPGATTRPRAVESAAELPLAVADAAAPVARGIAATELLLALDLDAPAPADADPLPPRPESARREALAPVAGPVIVLAGPGVVRAGAVDGLRAFAAAGKLGVANTWGAKGVFRWDSPHHMGTAGLQERDFELLGFAEAAAIVATGIDVDESPTERFALAPVVPVAPHDLTTGLARQLAAEPTGPIGPNDLRERLAAVAGPGYEAKKVPLHPARAVADVRATLPPGGVVASEPGLAGLWLARTFPTTEPGTVIVPATGAPGVAAGIALGAARRGHPAVALVDEPVDDATRALVALASSLGLRFVLEVWGLYGGGLAHADEHAPALAAAFATPGVTEMTVPVDAADVRFLAEAAGTVVAWGGLPGPS